MQVPGAQPYPVFIPAQHFNACPGFIGKDESRTFVPRGFQRVLYILRQGIDPTAHVHGFHCEEDIIGFQRPEDIG